MSDVSQGPGWWIASDGKWYPPHLHPRAVSPHSDAQDYSATVSAEAVPTGGLASSPIGAPSTSSGGSVAPPSRRRGIPSTPWIVASVLLVAALIVGLIAINQTSSADKWRKDDQKALAELAVARRTIKSLNAKVATLNKNVSSLDTQLSAQANAKEKALDQNTVLGKIVAAESTVSTELNNCVTDLDLLLRTVATALATNSLRAADSITSEATTAGTVCRRAQADNQALQSAIRTATG